MELILLFTGNATGQRMRNVREYVVGPAGDLKIWEAASGDKVRVAFVIAPGQWRYIEVLRDADDQSRSDYSLAVSELPPEAAAVDPHVPVPKADA